MDMQEPPAFIICNGGWLDVRQDTLRALKLRSGQVVDEKMCLEAIRENAERALVDLTKEREKHSKNPGQSVP